MGRAGELRGDKCRGVSILSLCQIGVIYPNWQDVRIDLGMEKYTIPSRMTVTSRFGQKIHSTQMEMSPFPSAFPSETTVTPSFQVERSSSLFPSEARSVEFGQRRASRDKRRLSASTLTLALGLIAVRRLCVRGETGLVAFRY